MTDSVYSEAARTCSSAWAPEDKLRRHYTTGYCHVLALALAQERDLSIVALIGWEGGEEIIVHVACEYPGDWSKVIDIDGVRERDAVAAQWPDVDDAYWTDVDPEWIHSAVACGALHDFDELDIEAAQRIARDLLSSLGLGREPTSKTEQLGARARIAR